MCLGLDACVVETAAAAAEKQSPYHIPPLPLRSELFIIPKLGSDELRRDILGGLPQNEIFCLKLEIKAGSERRDADSWFVNKLSLPSLNVLN
jgi:hypothetical protein